MSEKEGHMNINGERIYKLAKEIFPICRSITGEGVRETLSILSDYISENMTIHDVPSGTQVFDWTVPKEWKIRQAYIEDEQGKKIIDFKDNNLHVMGYSTPIDKWASLEELKKYIYTQQDQPDVIPDVTSYYKEEFGFCMSENQKNSLVDGKYHMYIDSELFDGSLTYGEVVIPGQTQEEIFFSTYVCHPSMANNECSGPALTAELINWIRARKNNRYTYRFIFIPETIGSITYLSRNLDFLKAHMKAGFVLTCVGDNREYSMVESKYGKTLADKVLKNVLSYHAPQYKKYSFLQRCSDERQYNAVGVELPVVAFCRSKCDEYPEYHTSMDNMTLVSPEGFQGSFDVITQVVEALEYNHYYKVNITCEPQLGKRGLYPTVSQKGSYGGVLEMKDFIAYADGKNDLIDISNIINVPVGRLCEIIEKLDKTGMLDKEPIH